MRFTVTPSPVMFTVTVGASVARASWSWSSNSFESTKFSCCGCPGGSLAHPARRVANATQTTPARNMRAIIPPPFIARASLCNDHRERSRRPVRRGARSGCGRLCGRLVGDDADAARARAREVVAQLADQRIADAARWRAGAARLGLGAEARERRPQRLRRGAVGGAEGAHGVG